MKMVVTMIPKIFVTNQVLFLFCPFEETRNNYQNFRLTSEFFLWRVQLYFKVIPNSIGFYKGIFLDVVVSGIVVP